METKSNLKILCVKKKFRGTFKRGIYDKSNNVSMEEEKYYKKENRKMITGIEYI